MNIKLVLSLPQGILSASSLSVPDLAAHRSPGAGKYFASRSVLVDLAIRDNKPAFKFLDEGGWRDADADVLGAMQATEREGKRTKTALSNNAFSCTPIQAWESVYLVKTGGETLALEKPAEIGAFTNHQCTEHMTPDDIARTIGQAPPSARVPRLYMVLCPIEMLMLTNLTPAEYVWYATHRPGKKFRAVVFAEIQDNPALRLAAVSIFDHAKKELAENATKKTKTVLLGDCFNRVPFSAWIGYDNEEKGGMYVGDANGARVWSFPTSIPRNWERAY